MAGMTKCEFKAAYITQFLASYMASRYDNDCMTGHPGKPYDHQPVEDAAFLAECAWEQLVEQAKNNPARFSELFNDPAIPSE